MESFDERLREIDDMIDLIVDMQRFYGKEYKRKLKELEAEYHKSIITSNRALVEQHIKRTAITGQTDYIVRVRYLNALDQECDTDAFWLAPEEPKIGDKTLLFDNIIHGIGDYGGVIVDMYELPGDALSYITVAVPYHYKPFWTTEYNKTDVVRD